MGPWVSEEQPNGDSVFQPSFFTTVLPPQALERKASGVQGPRCGARLVGPDSLQDTPGTLVSMYALGDLGPMAFSLQTLAEITICFAPKNLKRLLIPTLFSLTAPSVMSSFDLCTPWDGSLEQRPASPLYR